MSITEHIDDEPVPVPTKANYVRGRYRINLTNHLQQDQSQSTEGYRLQQPARKSPVNHNAVARELRRFGFLSPLPEREEGLCPAVTKDGDPCRNRGQQEYDGFCSSHQERKHDAYLTEPGW